MAEPISESSTELPLDSPNWVPLGIPHRWLAERTGNPDLAAHDLTKIFAIPPPEGVRTMVRRWPYEDRELLPSSHWTTHYASWDILRSRSRIRVWPARLHNAMGPEGPIHEDVHYTWKPDLMRVWPEMFPSVPAKEVVSVTAPTTTTSSLKPLLLPKSVAKKLRHGGQIDRVYPALQKEFPPHGKTPRTLSAQRCTDRLSNAGHWKAENEEFGLTDPSPDVVGKAMNLLGRTNN